MKHYFIQKTNNPYLTVFFLGWGMDEHPFMNYLPVGSDLLVCYDYRTLDFDFSLLEGYRSIRLVGWSMGVWAASMVFQHTPIPVTESIAMCGTKEPISDEGGIPVAIFDGTLKGLNAVTLRKFYRRMCGVPEIFNDFMKKRPQRPLEELIDELRCIREQVLANPIPDFNWEKALAAKDDAIFPYRNQINTWDKDTPFHIYKVPHYYEGFLRCIIYGSRYIFKAHCSVLFPHYKKL